MKVVDNIEEVLVNPEELIERAYSADLCLFDCECILTPFDESTKYLERYYRKFNFTNSVEAVNFVWEKIWKPYLLQGIKEGNGRWVTPKTKYTSEMFYDQFFLNRDATEVVGEMQQVGSEDLKPGTGTIELLDAMKFYNIGSNSISAGFLPFLRPLSNKLNIHIHAKNVNITNERISRLIGTTYAHSNKFNLTLGLIAKKYAPEKVVAIGEGISDLEWCLHHDNHYRFIAFNPSKTLLKEISTDEALGVNIVIGSDLRTVGPLIDARTLEYDDIEKICKSGKYFEKKPGVTWSAKVTGLGKYSMEFADPIDLSIDNSVHGYRKQAITKYRKTKI